MKIEKVNDNQICCTLTKDDLSSRQMRLSELAYGTEKAKRLFQEMIHQASYECGFEMEDSPVMIEAIPMPEESIIILITKVEYPEELDARFSDFSGLEPDEHGESYESMTDEDVWPKAGAANSVESDSVKAFEFDDLQQVETLAGMVEEDIHMANTLYSLNHGEVYVLILYKSSYTTEEFAGIGNFVAEYARSKPYSSAIHAYYKEHGRMIFEGNALQEIKKHLIGQEIVHE